MCARGKMWAVHVRLSVDSVKQTNTNLKEPGQRLLGGNCICKIKSVFMVLGWLVWHQLMINVEVISIRTTLVLQKQTAAPSMYDGRQATASRVDRHSPKAYSWRKGQTKYRLFESFFKLILWMKGQVSIGSKMLDPPIWYPSSPWEVVTSRVCVWGGGRGEGSGKSILLKFQMWSLR